MGSKRTAEQATRAMQDQGAEPNDATLSQVERDTAGQQKRIHRQVVREGREDTRTQAEKFAGGARNGSFAGTVTSTGDPPAAGVIFALNIF